MLPVSIPGIENLSPAVKYVIAFAIIFVLLALFALILRRLTGGRMSLSNDRGRARQPRLGIVDVYDLDRQRQLILLRRDNVEHLLLVGGPNDVVVETNIVRVPGARLPAAPVAAADDRPEPPPARNVEIAPVRPALESGNGRSNPAFEPSIGATLGSSDALAGLSGRQEAGRQEEPSGGGLESILKPNRVVASPNPEPAPMRQAAPPPRPVPPRANPLPAGNDGASGDMTRQLEAALRRPSPPVETPRVIAPDPKPIPPPPPPMPAPPPPQRVVEAPPPPPPRPVPAPVAAEPPAPPAPVPPPARAPSPPPPPRAEPSPPPPAQPAKDAAPSPNPAKPDPFSIEDIEAEFARLLGRPLEKKD